MNKILIIILITAILAGAQAAAGVSSTATVLNAEPSPMRYWIDGLGAVNYNKTVDEFMPMYPKNCISPCEAVQYWDSNNPKNFVIRLNHSQPGYRYVPVTLELEDANGVGDVTAVTVSEMVSLKSPAYSIPPFPLYLISSGVSTGNYSNTFKLKKDASPGQYRIQFSITDSAGIHYTRYGHFYLNREKIKGEEEDEDDGDHDDDDGDHDSDDGEHDDDNGDHDSDDGEHDDDSGEHDSDNGDHDENDGDKKDDKNDKDKNGKSSKISSFWELLYNMFNP